MVVGSQVLRHPPWKVALWARDSIEPAMLRVPIVVIIFLALWGINLWIIDKLRLPVSYALPIKTVNASYIFAVAGFLIASYAFIITIFTDSLGLTIETALLAFYVFYLGAHFLPILQSPDRNGFYRILKLVFLPGNSITFPEVLLADALTSMSKVLKDLGTSFVVIFAQTQGKVSIDYHDNAMYLVAIVASLPFWLRVRQCWIQLDSCPDNIAKIPVCLNILKYISAFPTIWLTAAASLNYVNPKLPQYITIAATVNSLFSFGWDFVMDWGLITIHRDFRVTRRQRALYPWYTYVFAVIINFILRFSWTVNRLPGMNHIHSSIIVLMIEIGEVFRRAMWNLFRIEWEILVQQDKSLDFDSDKMKSISGKSTATSSASLIE